MCDDTHIDRNTHAEAVQQVAALRAEIESLTQRLDWAATARDNYADLRRTLLNAVNALAVESVEDGDDESLDTACWQALLDLGVTDPRTGDVNITFTATRTMTSEITLTISGVRRSIDLDAIDIELDCADITNRRDVEYGVSVGGIGEYDSLTVSIGYNSDETEIEGVEASFD